MLLFIAVVICFSCACVVYLFFFGAQLFPCCVPFVCLAQIEPRRAVQLALPLCVFFFSSFKYLFPLRCGGPYVCARVRNMLMDLLNAKTRQKTFSFSWAVERWWCVFEIARESPCFWPSNWFICFLYHDNSESKRKKHKWSSREVLLKRSFVRRLQSFAIDRGLVQCVFFGDAPGSPVILWERMLLRRIQTGNVCAWLLRKLRAGNLIKSNFVPKSWYYGIFIWYFFSSHRLQWICVSVVLSHWCICIRWTIWSQARQSTDASRQRDANEGVNNCRTMDAT